jgi:hypothetical protein
MSSYVVLIIDEYVNYTLRHITDGSSEIEAVLNILEDEYTMDEEMADTIREKINSNVPSEDILEYILYNDSSLVTIDVLRIQ